MPKIEDFKRKNIRAWDKNLLDALTIKTPNKDSNRVQLESNKDSNRVQLESNKDSNRVQLESNKDSNRVQLESNKDSNRVQLESNKDSNRVQLESNKDSNRVQLESNKDSNRVQLESNKDSNRVQLESNKDSNRVQLESNKDSNRVQLESNKDSNRVQLESNKDSNRVQLESNKDSNRVQLESNKDSNRVQLESNKDSNRVQLESNSLVNILPRISNNEKKILIALLVKMIASESNSTQDVNTKELTQSVGTTINGLKTGLKRLVKKGVIYRESGKRGVGGVMKFSTTTIIKNKLLHYLSEDIADSNKGSKPNNPSPIYNSITTNINKYKTQDDQHRDSKTDKDKIIAELQKQLELQNQKQSTYQTQTTEATSKKEQLTAYLNNHISDTNTNNTTENAPATEDDQEAWANIDFSALALCGFKKSHIKQIINTKTTLTPQEVQESIEHYAWALNHRAEEMQNYAPKNNPLRGLMGVLKKGSPWIEAQYRSPEDIAIEEQIKAKQAQLERKIAQKEALLTTEFNLWYADLTAESLTTIEVKGELDKQMSPTAFRTKGDNASYINALKRYFKQHIYTG